MALHRAIADTVKPFGDDWKQQSNLEKIAALLDQDKKRTPPKNVWADLNPPARSWKRALSNDPERVRKALAYSLEMVARDIST